MRILLPLGFLGLIGIIVLIIIYLLKPNYQQKIISSTYIWKLSLRYRKKRIPISKLRSLLILLCQIIVVTACAFILAHPITPSSVQTLASENVAIIDASASMRTATDNGTRFERAVEKARALAQETFKKEDGVMSVIFAGDEPYFIVQRITASSADELYTSLDALLTADNGETACTYAAADVSTALTLAQTVVDENALAEVYLYTGTEYLNPANVKVVDVSDKENGEWNAAILDARAVKLDNTYSFEVDLAVYGKDAQIEVYCDVFAYNGTEKNDSATPATVTCTSDETQTYTFKFVNLTTDYGEQPYIYSFDYVWIYIQADDSYTADNNYYIYGGTRDRIKIQYSTSSSSKFWLAALESLQNALADRWDFADPKEVRITGTETDGIALTGYDFYVFEGKMPASLPDYGVIFIVNPSSVPSGADFTMSDKVSYNETLTGSRQHAITSGVDATKIKLKEYTRIAAYDGYEPLLFAGDDPVLMVKEDLRKEDGIYRTVILMSFSINNASADFAIGAFPQLFLNMFKYTIPTTITTASGAVSNAFEVGESVLINPRGIDGEIKNSQYDYDVEVVNFEGSFSKPGTYVVSHTVLFEEPQEKEEKIFVKIAATESNIFKVEESLAGAIIRDNPPDDSKDWLVYLAIILTAFLFIEWLLQAKDNF